MMRRIARIMVPTDFSRASDAALDYACALAGQMGAPARRIVEHAREIGAYLIVMGTHGRTGPTHLLLGSVTERVVRTSNCPVLTTREPETAASTLGVVAA
jgi:nucleotide-binding universal stress UspA family protein